MKTKISINGVMTSVSKGTDDLSISVFGNNREQSRWSVDKLDENTFLLKFKHLEVSQLEMVSAYLTREQLTDISNKINEVLDSTPA
jgi:ABC-type xylose transport system substrate-binding protein